MLITPRPRIRRAAAVAAVVTMLAACAQADDDGDAASDPDIAADAPSDDGAGPTDDGASSPRPSISPSAEDDVSKPSLDPSTRVTGSEVASDGVEPVVEQLPSAVTDEVLRAASDRVGLPTEELTLVRAQAVQFSDGSLGCPEPGRSYTQALVEGYWVVVDAGDEQLDYRVAESGAPRLCEGGGQRPAPRGDT